MSKILSTAIVAGLLFGITVPAFAADAPKTIAAAFNSQNAIFPGYLAPVVAAPGATA